MIATVVESIHLTGAEGLLGLLLGRDIRLEGGVSDFADGFETGLGTGLGMGLEVGLP